MSQAEEKQIQLSRQLKDIKAHLESCKYYKGNGKCISIKMSKKRRLYFDRNQVSS